MAIAAAGITASTLARRMHVAPSTLSRKVHGHRPWLDDEFEQLARILGVPSGWLIDGDREGVS